MKDKDFQVGNCCKTKSRIFITKNFYIPGNSNVIFLGSINKFASDHKTIRILHEGIFYQFSTIYDICAWLEEI